MNEPTPLPRIGILLTAYEKQLASAEELRELFGLLDSTGGEVELKQAVLETLRQWSAGKSGVTGNEKESAGKNVPVSGTDPVWNGINNILRQRRRRPIK